MTSKDSCFHRSAQWRILLAVTAIAFLVSACTASQVYWNTKLAPYTGGQRLRVISYNIALGYMLETRDPNLIRLSRETHSIRAAIERHPHMRDFDILGLQEVCSDKDFLARIQGDRHVYFGRADPGRDAECRKGQALLSRYPIVSAGTIYLPNVRKVGRSAIWADIRVPGQKEILRAYNVHLENRGNESVRAQQTLTVLRHALAWRNLHPGAPLIILGDFNSIGDRMSPGKTESCIAHMAQHMESALPEQVSTHILAYQTDWIFFSELSLTRAHVVDLVRSDHYPIVADFVLGAVH